jgi:ABC-type Fe3+/spermidine/putrescine transport system ATPase subunit
MVHVGDHNLPAPEGTEHLSGQMVDILLRPESIDLALSKEDLNGNALGEGQIESITFAGALERITVRLTDREDPIEIVIAPERARRMGIRPGDRVWVGVSDYHLLPANKLTNALTNHHTLS